MLASLAGLGVHPDSLPIFQEKLALEPLLLKGVRSPAANIIKQELLALGADAATPLGAVTCQMERVDVILLGSRRHYRRLLGKLQLMPYFGLAEWGRQLAAYLAARQEALYTELADGRCLDYRRVQVMGIINLTPDSFYPPSRAASVEQALERGEQLLAEGADILDLGAVSTRPGSLGLSQAEEEERLLPALAALRQSFPQAVLSIDTYNGPTAAAALALGADLLNDITAGEGDAGLLEAAAQAQAPVILMHMRGTPAVMQQLTAYDNVVEEVAAYLAQRAQAAAALGLGREKVILDPGLGFAKTAQQSLLLVRDLATLAGLGYPVLVGASRKSCIAAALGGAPVEERLQGTIAAHLRAVAAGAKLLRVHDVKEHVAALRLWQAIEEAGPEPV